MKNGRIASAALLIILAAALTAAQTNAGGYSHLAPQHRAALKKWLAHHDWMRPATSADSFNMPTLMRELRISHQFYATGDFNRDGRQDFAVLLVVKGKQEMALAVFNGPFRHARPAYFERHFDRMDTLYISYDRAIKRRLFLGVSESDWYCMILIPRGRGYTYRDCNR
jgi:hypothetical protein